MTEQQKIEEMQNTLLEGLKPLKETYGTDEIVRILYNAGWRKQSEGEWLNAGMFDDMAKCSVCGLIDHSLNEVYSRGTYNFCPNCGARMTKGEKENE